LDEFPRVSLHEDGTLRGVIEVVDVRDDGAKGDGSSDDSPPLQAAIADFDGTGCDGSQVADVLSSSLLFAPPSPSLPAPTLTASYFGSAGTATRPTRSGGSFTRTWNNSTLTEGYAWISLEVLHILSAN